MAAGLRIAAPAPCTSRALISTVSVVAKPAKQRARHENHCAEKEHPTPPEDVRCATGDQQQTTEGEEVRVQDPGGADGGEVEVRGDRRERDVQDARVEHHHELRRHQGEKERRVGVLRMCSHLSDRAPHGAAAVLASRACASRFTHLIQRATFVVVDHPPSTVQDA